MDSIQFYASGSFKVTKGFSGLSEGSMISYCPSDSNGVVGKHVQQRWVTKLIDGSFKRFTHEELKEPKETDG